MTLHRPVPTLLAALVLVVGVTSTAQAQNPTQPATAQAAAPAPAPALGVVAPDFTAPGANASGPAAGPISLSGLKGQVVVLAFYPKDRSSGCTAELTKFRDEYRTLFPEGVVVLPISVDDMESHVGWAKDMNFPFTLVADDGGQIATRYGSMMSLHATPTVPRTPADVATRDVALQELLFFGLYQRGVYTAPRGMINLSLPLTDDQLSQFLDALDDTLTDLGQAS